MRVLALDTSTLVGSVALTIDDELVCEVSVRVRASHGESLLPWIDLALRAGHIGPDELDLLAYSRGPGSFTGVRIGLALAKGFSVATGVPMLGISSLRVLAEQLQACSAVVAPLIDARKQEVYVTAFRFGQQGTLQLMPETVCSPAQAGRYLRELADVGELLVVGEGARVYQQELTSELGPAARFAPRSVDTPRGVILARLASEQFARGERDDPALASPAYLRPPDAEYKPLHR